MNRRLHTSTKRIALWMLLVALVVLAACGSGSNSASSASSSEASSPAPSSTKDSPVAQTFDIGAGRQLYVECRGSGSPTVLLEAGDESGTDEWSRVAPKLESTARVCSYDRAGVGKSVAATGCRGIDDIVGDLEALLKAASVAGPYVLVGASGGGFLMAEYASRHPADVAGIVLVETPKAITILPPGLKEAIACTAPMNIEHRDYYSVEHAAWDDRAAIGSFPMTVISYDWGTHAPPGGDEQTNVADQRGWLVLSPKATQVVVTSGHDVANNEPDVVIQSIFKVITGG
jgi:pimeloyl-ACP methyl ester carboxylesterase